MVMVVLEGTALSAMLTECKISDLLQINFIMWKTPFSLWGSALYIHKLKIFEAIVIGGVNLLISIIKPLKQGIPWFNKYVENHRICSGNN